MAYYSAHYGENALECQRIDFGENRGIQYLYRTTDYREAIEKAQAVANETGKIVHFCKSTPVAGFGLRDEWREIYPVRGKIKFVRMYENYRENWYDVVYTSGRVMTCAEPYLPKTVERFIETSTIRKEQHDNSYKRDEMLYF